MCDRCNIKVEVWLYCLLTILLFSPLYSYSFAQNSAPEKKNAEEIDAELGTLKKKIAKANGRLKKLDAHKVTITRELAKVARNIKQGNKQKETLKGSIEQLTADVKELEVAVKETEEHANALQKNFEKRIVALFKAHRKKSVINILLGAKSNDDRLKRAKYLSVISAHDNRMIARLKRAYEELALERKRLEEKRESEVNSLNELEEVMGNLVSQQKREKKLLQAQNTRARLLKKTLASLQKSAGELEGLLAGFMGDKNAKQASRGDLAPQPVFQGRGLARYRGGLKFPVKGNVVQGFGKRKHQDYSATLFSKGIEVNAQAGSQVKAVARGKVIFRNALPVYGNVIILDHGKRYYTLYGRLKEMLPKVGDIVKVGQKLGTISANAASQLSKDIIEKNFYFELRLKGKAIDPKRYFSNFPSKIK